VPVDHAGRITIGHRTITHLTTMVKLDALVYLIFERTTPDALSAFARVGRVSCLSHEILDDAMEDVVIVISIHTVLNKVPTCQRAFLRP